jgi:hypothetical protein
MEVPVARNRKSKTLLQIAVETRFHSLVELIARHETNQSSKNAALADSVSLRRMDFVESLVENGAEINSVPLVDVLLTWEPRLCDATPATVIASRISAPTIPASRRSRSWQTRHRL